MKHIFFAIFVVFALSSCGGETVQAPSDALAGGDAFDVPEPGGNEIVYNVYLKPQDLRDPYAPELYAGFDRAAFVDSLFAAIYYNGAEVTDMSGNALSIDDIKQREVEDPKYSRDKVACVQFREAWAFSPTAKTMRKSVKSMLVGYEVVEDSMIVTLRPGFVFHFPSRKQDR